MAEPALTIKRVERHSGYPDFWLVTNGRQLFLSNTQARCLCDGLNLMLDEPDRLIFENAMAQDLRLEKEAREMRINSKSFAPLPGKRIIPKLEDLA